jgi:monomeric sarcosine oxidase
VKEFSAIVVGTGILGLSSAYNLLRREVGTLALIEQFSFGHNQGSSHGNTRVARALYLNTDYSLLYHVALNEDWKHLEDKSGEQLFYPCPICLYSCPADLINDYAESVIGKVQGISSVSVESARERFPEIILPDQAKVLIEETSGVIAARRTLELLKEFCLLSGAELFEKTKILKIEIGSHRVTLETNEGTFAARYLVLALGAWISLLLPYTKPILKVIPQTLGYFKPSNSQRDYSCKNFPIWIRLQVKNNLQDCYYGLPPIEGNLIKVCHEVVEASTSFDPRISHDIKSSSLEDLQNIIQSNIKNTDWELDYSESCLYTVTATGNFVIDFSPDSNRVVVVGGGSGHAFKFGPLIGRAVANMLLDGNSKIASFENMRHLFTLV